jgi:hypothetical protein
VRRREAPIRGRARTSGQSLRLPRPGSGTPEIRPAGDRRNGRADAIMRDRRRRSGSAAGRSGGGGSGPVGPATMVK